VNPTSSPGQLRDWITAHLDPLEPGAARDWGFRSDYDLGPDLAPQPPQSLTDAAVLIGLVEREHGYSVILTRRSDTLRKHTGQVALPGGRCDPGETPWETALREAHEEIGLHPDRVTLAGLSTPYRTGTGYHVIPVVGFVAPGPPLKANPHEVADIFETPFGFLMDSASYEEREGVAPTGETRRYYAATWENQFIWGATAGMLRALYDRLYGAALA